MDVLKVTKSVSPSARHSLMTAARRVVPNAKAKQKLVKARPLQRLHLQPRPQRPMIAQNPDMVTFCLAWNTVVTRNHSQTHQLTFQVATTLMRRLRPIALGAILY